MSQQNTASSNPSDNRISSLSWDDLCCCPARSELSKRLFLSVPNTQQHPSSQRRATACPRHIWPSLRIHPGRFPVSKVTDTFCSTVPKNNPRREFCPLFTVTESVTLPQDDSTCDWMECKHGAAKDTIGNDRNGLGRGELHVRLCAKEGKKAPVHAMSTVLLCVLGPPV